MRPAFPLLTLVLAVVPTIATAASWRDALAPADLARIDRLSARVEALYDTTRGGYVTKDGTPSESAVMLALANGEAGQGSYWSEHARFTVEWMDTLVDPAVGGMYDHKSHDDDMSALVDKGTVVNARRLGMLIAAWKTSGDAADRKRAAALVDFADRILVDPRGGFVVSQMGDRDPLPEPNGCMVQSWLEWAALNGDGRRRDFAWKSLDRAWTNGWVDGIGLVRTGVFGETRTRAFLTDQVEMGRAFLVAAVVGARPADHARAVQLGELVLAHFEDTDKGGLRSQWVLNKKGEGKPAGREMDENARAARFLYELARFTSDARYRAAADRITAAFDDPIEKMGFVAADWALATRAKWVNDLPDAPEWRVAMETPHRAAPRSTTYRTGRR